MLRIGRQVSRAFAAAHEITGQFECRNGPLGFEILLQGRPHHLGLALAALLRGASSFTLKPGGNFKDSIFITRLLVIPKIAPL